MVRRLKKIMIIVCMGIIATAVINGSAKAADNIDFNISVKDSLGLNISASTITVTANPSSKPFSTNNLTTTVGTNNLYGYTLTMTADGTDLVEESDNTKTISTLASALDETAFKALSESRWGYKNSRKTDTDSSLSNTNYYPFASGDVVSTSPEAVNADVANLVFGTHVGYATTAGTYKLTLNFIATANTGTKYMQDLKASDCTTTPTIVQDARDDKEYTIARLEDGKCWMVTNLNLAGGTPLYSDTSNVPSGYPKSGGTAYYTLPASSSSGFSSDTTAYVYNTGKETASQSECGSSPCNSYYSWLAAVAGNKENITGNGVDTSYSICPSGWKLPSSGNYNDSSATSTTGYKKGDFYKLAVAYGMNSSNYYQNSTDVFYKGAGPDTTANFLLAGYYNNGSFVGGGSYGFYWSSSSYSSTYAYYLFFDSSDVNSAYRGSRRLGFPVRCVLVES